MDTFARYSSAICEISLESPRESSIDACFTPNSTLRFTVIHGNSE